MSRFLEKLVNEPIPFPQTIALFNLGRFVINETDPRFLKPLAYGLSADWIQDVARDRANSSNVTSRPASG